MADYYLLIATAVSGLEDSTDGVRTALYDRARNTLVGQLRGAEPPLSAQAITRELLALEQAILKVEAKAAAHLYPRERRQHKRPTDYYPYLVEGLNGLETSTDGARGALYDRVRDALAGQLRGVEPPLSAQEITRERLALEQALSKVETEAVQRQLEEEAKRKAEEQRRQREDAKRKAEEERRQREEAKRTAKEEAKRKAEEEHRRREEEAKRKAEEERRRSEEEVRRKAEEERQSHVIRGRLAVAASPAPSLSLGSKHVYDISTGDENLPLLPLRQRALIKTILAGLPQETPAQLKASLQNYDDELRVRGARPILGLLKDMAEIIEADLGAPNARCEWLDEGILKAFTRFAENHALFMKHFPLDPKREALYLNASADEDNANRLALRKHFEDVANATLNANKHKLTTDDLLKIVDKIAEFAKVTLTSITNEPTAESNPDNE